MRKFLIIAIIPILSSCGIYKPYVKRESALMHIEPGDSVKKCSDAIGFPDSMRASWEPEKGKLSEILEYRLFQEDVWWENLLLGPITGTLSWWFPIEKREPYLLQFSNRKLDKWGKEGDWFPRLPADIIITNTQAATH